MRSQPAHVGFALLTLGGLGLTSPLAKATVYKDYISSGTTLYSGDYLTSPEGLYYAFLDSSGSATGTPGLFVVAAGSNPTIAPVTPSCNNCYYPVTGTPSQNLGGFFAQLGNNADLVVYSSATGKNQGPVVQVSDSGGGQLPPNPPYYATIQDDVLNHNTMNTGSSWVVYQGNYPNQSSPLALSEQTIVGPVTGIQLNQINYDTANVKFTSNTSQVFDETSDFNPSPQPVQFTQGVKTTYSVSNSFSFNYSSSVSEGVSASTTIGVPKVATVTVGFSIVDTTGISHGQATTTTSSVTFSAGARPVVPSGHEYVTFLSGVQQTYTIPFTFSGIATYQGGTTAEVEGSGTFTGGSSGDFQVETFDCDQLTVCPSIPFDPSSPPPGWTLVDPSLTNRFFDVPEPGSTALLLSIGMLGLGGFLCARNCAAAFVPRTATRL